MRHHGSKLENANVVAAFDSQWDAEEAVLALRIRGIPDRRIGYYFPTEGGKMQDLLANRHRFAASVLGGAIGFALGVVGGLLWAQWGYPAGQSPDARGFAMTWGVIGALFIGTAGGMMGLWTARPGAYAPTPSGPREPFVIAVDAGDARDAVRAILFEHGGHEMHPAAAVPHGAEYLPGAHPA